MMSRRLNLLLRLEWVVRILQRLRLHRVVIGMRRLLESAIGDHVEADVEGMRMRAPIAERGYLELLARRKKDAHLVERFLRHVRPGARVVDGGAHWGYFTLLAAQAVGSEGSVVAFEPDPRSAQRLEWNIHANGFGDRVTLIRAALSDRSGERQLFTHPRHHSWSSLFAAPGSGVAHAVPALAADEAIQGEVDVVKLDVEGGEVEALRGMRALIGRRRPVLFVECHPDALRRAGASVAGLVGEIRDAGYRIRAIDERTGELAEVGAALDHALFANLYCEPLDDAEPRSHAQSG
jgi:FkbM family methyltransferase